MLCVAAVCVTRSSCFPSSQAFPPCKPWRDRIPLCTPLPLYINSSPSRCPLCLRPPTRCIPQVPGVRVSVAQGSPAARGTRTEPLRVAARGWDPNGTFAQVGASRLIKRWHARIGLSHASLTILSIVVTMLFTAHWYACVFALEVAFSNGPNLLLPMQRLSMHHDCGCLELPPRTLRDEHHTAH